MNKELIKEIYNEIKANDVIVIHRHKRPDFDAIGSQTALKQMLQLNFPNKKIYAVGEDGYEEFAFIGKIDKNVIIDYEKALVITVDTANYARVEDNRFKKGKTLIKIDHHPDIQEERYADINFVYANYSSTSELLYFLYETIKADIDSEFKINSEIARSLFCGIYGDTGGFVFPNTTSDTYKALSGIMKHEFGYEELMMQLRILDEDVVRLIGWSYKNIEIKDGIGILTFDKKLQRELNATSQQLSIVVNYLGIFGSLKAWAVFNEYDKFIRINMRSRYQYNVSEIAMLYNGGGHKNASGAMIYDWQDKEKVIAELRKMVN